MTRNRRRARGKTWWPKTPVAGHPRSVGLVCGWAVTLIQGSIAGKSGCRAKCLEAAEDLLDRLDVDVVVAAVLVLVSAETACPEPSHGGAARDPQSFGGCTDRQKASPRSLQRCCHACILPRLVKLFNLFNLVIHQASAEWSRSRGGELLNPWPSR